MILRKDCLWLWNHSSIGISDLRIARLTNVSAVQAKALLGRFYFKLQFFQDVRGFFPCRNSEKLLGE